MTALIIQEIIIFISTTSFRNQQTTAFYPLQYSLLQKGRWGEVSTRTVLSDCCSTEENLRSRVMISFPGMRGSEVAETDRSSHLILYLTICLPDCVHSRSGH